MKVPALMAIFMSWFLLVIAIIVQNFLGQPDAINRMGLLWMGATPILVAAAIGIAYREGQWSKK